MTLAWAQHSADWWNGWHAGWNAAGLPHNDWPALAMVVLVVIVLLGWLFRRGGHTVPQRPCCAKCGYDLSGICRCPECGSC